MLPMTYYQDQRPGNLLTLLSSDSEAISGFVTTTLVQLLPLVLTSSVKVSSPVAKDQWITYGDVEAAPHSVAWKLRLEMEKRYCPEGCRTKGSQEAPQ